MSGSSEDSTSLLSGKRNSNYCCGGNWNWNCNCICGEGIWLSDAGTNSKTNNSINALPWNQSDWRGWTSHLSGSPFKLLFICILQTLVLVIGVFLGIGNQQCEIDVQSGSSVHINCDNCWTHTYVSWQQIALLCVGVVVILIGILAATLRSKRLCRFYGLIMMIYAFVIGLTALLTGLDVVVLKSALKSLLIGTECHTYVASMIHTTEINSILFAINCILDCAGAIYAIKSKELFEFQAIADRHAKLQANINL